MQLRSLHSYVSDASSNSYHSRAEHKVAESKVADRLVLSCRPLERPWCSEQNYKSTCPDSHRIEQQLLLQYLHPLKENFSKNVREFRI